MWSTLAATYGLILDQISECYVPFNSSTICQKSKLINPTTHSGPLSALHPFKMLAHYVAYIPVQIQILKKLHTVFKVSLIL